MNGDWRKLFQIKISDVISIADPLEGNEIDLEANKLVVVRFRSYPTRTIPHIFTSHPSVLVLAGDASITAFTPFSTNRTGKPVGVDCRA